MSRWDGLVEDTVGQEEHVGRFGGGYSRTGGTCGMV